VHELTAIRIKAKHCITYKCEMQQRALPQDTTAYAAGDTTKGH